MGLVLPMETTGWFDTRYHGIMPPRTPYAVVWGFLVVVVGMMPKIDSMLQCNVIAVKQMEVFIYGRIYKFGWPSSVQTHRLQIEEYILCLGQTDQSLVLHIEPKPGVEIST